MYYSVKCSNITSPAQIISKYISHSRVLSALNNRLVQNEHGLSISKQVRLTLNELDRIWLFPFKWVDGMHMYPVHCAKLTLIQPTWSAYPYHLVFIIWYPYSLVFLIGYPYTLVSLYGNTADWSGCGVAMGWYGLSIVPRPAIALLFRRIRADVSETPHNALTTRMHDDHRLSIDRISL